MTHPNRETPPEAILAQRPAIYTDTVTHDKFYKDLAESVGAKVWADKGEPDEIPTLASVLATLADIQNRLDDLELLAAKVRGDGCGGCAARTGWTPWNCWRPR